MIGIKRSLAMLAAGAALAVSGSLGASAAPAGSPSPALSAGASDNGVMQVKRDWNGGGGGGKKWSGGGGGKNWSGGGGGKRWSGGGGGKNWGHRRHRGHSNFWYGAPFVAAPFLYYGYNDYDDYGYGYSSYGYGGGNSCYRACRYEHGPRFCRYNWEDYC